jgi:glycosyltransferase involved in cell wall biosynthesis
MSIRVAMLSTFPPTQCGIATFARSLATSMSQFGPEISIVNVNQNNPRNPHSIVIAEHRDVRDLHRTLHVINSHNVAVIQHEFGIYGGDDGSEVLDIVRGITVPLITVLHTVVSHPTPNQRFVMQALLERSDRVVTLSKSALRTLLLDYHVDLSRVEVIPHGAPPLHSGTGSSANNGRPRMLTWGLLGRGKGVEWGIEALARLGDSAPEYFVVGQTHPKVLETEGTLYRDGLEHLARRRGVADRVHFIDGYLDDTDLAQLIMSTHVFLLPYDSRDQVTSGVLAEAMVAGGPVIATRFPHAVELLGDGTGILVEHESPASIEGALQRLLRQPDLHQRLRERTHQKAKSFLWSSVGMNFSRLVHSVWDARSRPRSHSDLLSGREAHRFGIPA